MQHLASTGDLEWQTLDEFIYINLSNSNVESIWESAGKDCERFLFHVFPSLIRVVLL